MRSAESTYLGAGRQEGRCAIQIACAHLWERRCGLLQNDDGKVIAHVAGERAAASRVAETELTEAIVAPAFEASVIQNDAGMPQTR